MRIDGTTSFVTINRPDVSHALDAAADARMAAVFGDFAARPDLHVTVIEPDWRGR